MSNYQSCPDHPDIRSAQLTGYPRYVEDSIERCEYCGFEIESDVYSDQDYDCLCERCLKELHRKDW